MAWSTRPSDTVPEEADINDAKTGGYICPKLGRNGTLTDRYAADTGCWTTAEWEADVAGNGDLGTDTRLPTKADINAWRLWNPANETIGTSLSASTHSFDGISLSWTPDANIPSVDSSWARNQVELYFEVSESSTFSVIFDTFAKTYSATSHTWIHASAVDGRTYYFRARYRNTTNTALVGAWSTTRSAAYKDGTV